MKKIIINESQLKTLKSYLIYESEKINSDEMNEDKNPCWKGYKMVGMKPNDKGDGEVPNCVPNE